MDGRPILAEWLCVGGAWSAWTQIKLTIHPQITQITFLLIGTFAMVYSFLVR